MRLLNLENRPCKKCKEIHDFITKNCVPIEHDQPVFERPHRTWGEIFPDGVPNSGPWA